MTSQLPQKSGSAPLRSSRPSYRSLLRASAGLGLAIIAAYLLQSYVHGPLWLVMLVAFAPPVLLIPLMLCLFCVSRYIVIPESGEPGEEARAFRRGDLLRQALRIGSPTWSVGFVMVVVVANNVVQYAEMPLGPRELIALTPLVPLAMYLRSAFRNTPEIDELALHIRRDAYGFVFCGMLGIFVCGDLLAKAGMVPGLKWSPHQMAVIMIALLFIGAWISSRRYR